MTRPLCFVLMPFGRKADTAGRQIDFDAVYTEFIAPSIEAAGLAPLRADEEMTGGIIHKPMYERLILCEYAVADLTTANANVFYELGLRHAVRPASTVLLFAAGSGQLPFDVALLRAIPYALGSDGTPQAAEGARAVLTGRLQEGRRGIPDSPLYQLVEDFPDVQRLKTDVFRERVHYAEALKASLARARKDGLDAVQAVEEQLKPIADAESGVVIDLFLSYRAVKGWTEMIALAAKMAPPLAETVLVQEQLGLALNRAGRCDEAERVILGLIERRGPSSETYGILGRIYKDRWEAAQKAGQALRARGLLDQAIDAYLKGFEADWRDAYPGINAVTLMELKDPPDPRGGALVPVVRYAVERRVEAGKPDYWDYSTLLELAVLAKDESKAIASLTAALAKLREPWEAETTARNLRLIREARERRGEGFAWALEIEQALTGPST
jgi:tetratricopeptide (TPR) repeat protein